jgi:hypothetical protein
MDDPIDQRHRARGIREDRRPLGERQVCREHQTPALVATTDDLVEQVCVAAVVGEVADLVEDEQPDTIAVVAQPPVEAFEITLIFSILSP